MTIHRILLTVIAVTSLIGCEQGIQAPGADQQGHSAPTTSTIKANAKVLDELPFDNLEDFDEARRGLIATPSALQVNSIGGDRIWDMPAYDFITGDAPDSVNPSLWRQASLNNIHGLFEVTQGIYQLRGFDLANLTLIEGETGWIVVDPATAVETAKVAWAFALQHLQQKPIVAVIFTHSHVDHFGGVAGLLEQAGTDPDSIRVIAPEGFMEAATSENILAGTTMGRRAVYMYGKQLARTERGHVDTGLGKAPAFGTASILPPTELINLTPQNKVIDGVRFTFQYAPESEAPAELTFYLPDHKAFCGAEILSRNMHNLYTLRGAKVRDALKWSSYIDEALTLFGDAEVFFASHHWPMWGKARIERYMKQQRDTYKYIHDQTMRLAAKGYTPGEIAEELDMPEALSNSFSSRGYYGTVRHNARAVYQAYFGWYDGNPAHLNPLPAEDAAERYLKLMGGSDELLSEAEKSFAAGDYRWVAEILNHLVFAEPGNAAAKSLLANSYDQLGYQAESGPWRDVYLSAAYELRHGAPKTPGIDLSTTIGLLKEAPVPKFFDAMATMLNGPDADGIEMSVKLVFTDIQESYILDIENAVLHHKPGQADMEVNATINLTHELFLRMVTGQAGLRETLMGDDLNVEGSRIDLLRFFSLFEPASGAFNIVTP